MGRKAKVWQRGGKGPWYATINGMQERLGDTRKEAEENLKTHKRERPAVVQPPAKKQFRIIADKFLDRSEKENAVETFRNQQYYLEQLCEFVSSGSRVRVGLVPLCDLTPSMVTEWLDATDWRSSTRAQASGVIKACVNWWVREYALAAHPLSVMRHGIRHARIRIFTPEEKVALFKAIREQNLRNFIYVLQETGARPFSELAKVEAKHVDLKAGTITLDEWKNMKKTGKKRIIYLNPPMIEFFTILLRQRPEGLLFTNTRGKRWSSQSCQPAMEHLQASTGIKDIYPYAWRHTWITEALCRGLSSTIVARLAGNSARTIEQYYDHTDQKKDMLREAILVATGHDGAVPPAPQMGAAEPCLLQ
jgi:integrase